MKILGLIPARGGSKGVPKKNIRLLGGKPLLAYSIESAENATLLDTAVVSTDSEEIYAIAAQYGCTPPFVRPDDLAQDNSSSLAVVQHAIAHFEAQDIFFDAVCLLQPTTPFRESGFIDRAIKKFIHSNADSLVSVLPVPHEYNPHWVFETNPEGLLNIATGEKNIISRRQDLPKAFHRDGSVYITKTSIIKNGSLYGNSVAFIESDASFHVNIDTPEDWERAEAIWKNSNNK